MDANLLREKIKGRQMYKACNTQTGGQMAGVSWGLLQMSGSGHNSNNQRTEWRRTRRLLELRGQVCHRCWRPIRQLVLLPLLLLLLLLLLLAAAICYSSPQQFTSALDGPPRRTSGD